MSNSVPPDRRPPRLRDDEPIALFVVFLVMGVILAWGLGWGRKSVDWAQLWGDMQAKLQPGTVSSVVKPLPRNEATAESRSPITPVAPATPGAIAPSPVAPTGSANLGASGTTEPNTPTASPAATTPPAPGTVPPPAPEVGTAIAFADVPQGYWATPFISALSARGIISGFPDGTFKPNQPVTRAEFAVQVQKAFTKPDRSSTKSFSDVPPGNKWSVAVDQAVKAGFMTGYPDGAFRPEQDVSRTEAVSAIVKGLDIPAPSDPTAVLQPYADQQTVPNWARSLVAAAVQKRIFTGNPDTNQLMAEQPATRADIAALIYKALEAEGK